MSTTAGPREVRAPRGTELTCKGWPQEAALRMLMNNLDPEVAERPTIWSSTAAPAGRRVPGRPSTHRARASPSRRRRDPADPVGQAGRCGADARMGAPGPDREQQPRPPSGPRGRSSAGSRPSGSRCTADDRGVVDLHRHAGILQGTYETFAAIGAKRGGTLAGTISLTAGLGGWAAHSRSRSR